MALRTMGSGSLYGRCQGRAAMARPNDDGTWRVSVSDPRHRDAGYDGWRLVGTDYPSAEAAVEATGMS